MTSTHCRNCGEWIWSERHTCAPAWEWRYLWREGEPSDWFPGEIRAHDAEDAAMKAAKAYDGDDHPLSRGSKVQIEVRLVGSEEVTRWDASAEMEPTYYVRAAEIPTQSEA